MSDYRTDSYNPLIDDPGFEMDIITAASRGDFRLVQRLLHQGADPGAANSSGWSPIMYAAHYGHIGVVRVLIEADACDVNHKEWLNQRTALMLAASNGHTKCVELLITAGGADITLTDSSGRTAADYAAAHGHANNQIIRDLLMIGSPAAATSSPVSVPTCVVTQCTPRKSSHIRQHTYDLTGRSSLSPASSSASPRLTVSSRSADIRFQPSCPKKTRSVMSRERVSRSCRQRIDFDGHVSGSQTSNSLPSSLSELLERLQLTEHLSAFAAHDIDLFTFPDLSDEDLVTLGITKLGHRKKLAAAQQRLIESVEIRSVPEAIFADYLLHERLRLQQENAKMKLFIAQWRDSVNSALDIVSRLFPEEPVHQTGLAPGGAGSPEFRSL